MIWVEILSHHRDVEASIRVSGPEALIGRGYDNDVIVDDPYVAVQHLRIFRDNSGQIVAEDVGSANGTFLDGGKDRLQRIVIDGAKPIRIGQTFLRVRAPDFVVDGYASRHLSGGSCRSCWSWRSAHSYSAFRRFGYGLRRPRNLARRLT